MDWEHRLERLGCAQEHHVTSWQARHVGASSRTVQRRVTSGRWTEPHPGVLGLAGATRLPVAVHRAALLAFSGSGEPTARVEQWRDRGMPEDQALAAAAMGDWATLCSLSAAWLQTFLPEPPPVPHLLVPCAANRAAGPQSGVRLHFHQPVAPALTTKSAMPCAGGAQTIVDLAREWRREPSGPKRLVRVIGRADSLRASCPEELQQLLEGDRRYWGKATLAEALAIIRAGQLSHSAVEERGRTLALEVADALGVTMTRAPYKIIDAGRVVAEVDAAVVDLRYGIEIDGAPHDDDEQQLYDSERDHRLRRLEWWIDRFPAHVVDLQPRRLQERVRTSLLHLLRDPHLRRDPQQGSGPARQI